MIEEIRDTTAFGIFAAIRRLPMPVIVPGWKDGGRYTFVAASPIIQIRTQDGVTRAIDSVSGNVTRYKDPFEALDSILAVRRYDGRGPFPFNGGAVGCLGYDLNSVIEPRLARHRGGPEETPQALIGVFDPVCVFEHATGRGYIISTNADTARFNEFKRLIQDAGPQMPKPFAATEMASSNMTRQAYLNMIDRAKDYISAGDIYQINLSQRLSIPVSGDPFDLFQRLSETHPAPFASFMDFGEFQVVSNTPERLLRSSGGLIETEPIKGTRPRGKDPAEDLLMVEELKQSRKERAEHVMIVDLERNDLGRVSAPGSVEVSAFEAVHTYEHLHHMVSTIRARLKPGISTATALKACFPGGSVTGAPKFRAMEIINELEPCARGIYTGGLGWMDFNGDMDFAMAIRTAIIKDGLLRLHVGGGIVADSVPLEEYDETLLKARDFLHALGAKPPGPASFTERTKPTGMSRH